MTSRRCSLLMSKKPKFGLDIDGVLVDFARPFNSWLEKSLGVKCPAHITDYSWYKCVPGLTFEGFWTEFDRFGQSGAYRDMPLIDGAKSAVRKIAEHYDVWFITSRPDYATQDTYDAIHRDFGFEPSKVIMARSGKKSNEINKLGIKFFVEDAPHHAEDIAENTNCKLYLMDTHYNREVKHPRATRVSDWDEILWLRGLDE